MLIALVLACAALSGTGDDGNSTPTSVTAKQDSGGSVEWAPLASSSLRFLGVMHGFRLLTEPGTRAGGFGLGSDYVRGLGNLHGWADGDPFYVNYVGHPMQGAVAAKLWTLHDPKYRKAEFGQSTAYWKQKLRGAAFAWAFSEQFEIGPLSENSIGHIQKDFPQQGFVDHVVTPFVGMGWSIGEDVLDRYIVKNIEARTGNRYARIFARTVLNPARTFANVMDWRIPWYRDSRPGVMDYVPDPVAAPMESSQNVQEVAPLEVTAGSSVRQVDGSTCVGGSGEAAYRVASDWQMVVAVGGCKMIGLTENVSGDALTYQLGPRWTPSPSGKWSPFAHVLIGGIKITQETLDPAEKQRVLAANKDLDPMLDYTLHSQYTKQVEANALAFTAGMGVDYQIHPALAIRVANIEYLHAGGRVAGGFQMTTGMVLRWGTW